MAGVVFVLVLGWLSATSAGLPGGRLILLIVVVGVADALLGGGSGSGGSWMSAVVDILYGRFGGVAGQVESVA